MLTLRQQGTHELSRRTGFWSRLLRPERLGQTLASLFWLGSVAAYGVSVAGDWLQVMAASSWLIANLVACLDLDR